MTITRVYGPRVYIGTSRGGKADTPQHVEAETNHVWINVSIASKCYDNQKCEVQDNKVFIKDLQL